MTINFRPSIYLFAFTLLTLMLPALPPGHARQPPRPADASAVAAELLPDLNIFSGKEEGNKYYFTVSNIGKKASPACQASVTFRKGPQQNSEAWHTWFVNVPPLVPGKAVQLFISSGTVNVQKKARVYAVDPDDKVPESNEGNNKMFSSFATGPSQPFPSAGTPKKGD